MAIAGFDQSGALFKFLTENEHGASDKPAPVNFTHDLLQ